MKNLIYILLLIPCLSFGQQQYEKIVTPTETYFKLNNLDTISIPKELPDGRWKVFYDNDTSKIKYIFWLKNNKVSGPFNSYWKNGSWAAIGSFKDDSLWTFRHSIDCEKDTTFSTGLWARKLSIGVYLPRKLYKLPFNLKDSTYIDKWLYENGSLFVERTYHMAKGIIKETWFYENGIKSSEYVKQNDFDIKTEWTSKDSIIGFDINAKNLCFEIGLTTSRGRFFRKSDGYYKQSIKDSNGREIAIITFTPKGKIKYYEDNQNGVLIEYKETGEIEIIYNKDKFKERKRKIKLKKE